MNWPRRACAAVALLSTAVALASSRTFTLGGADPVAGTNELVAAGWRFNRLGYYQTGGYCFNNAESWLETPWFAAAITNVVFRGYGVNSCTRSFSLQALKEDGGMYSAFSASISAEDYPLGAAGYFTPIPAPTGLLHRFRLACAGGAQICYFHSITLMFDDGQPTPPLDDEGEDPDEVDEVSLVAVPLHGQSYSQDFSSLADRYANASAATFVWTNSVSLPGWQIAKDGALFAAAISRTAGTATRAAPYVLRMTNAADSATALASYALGSKVSREHPRVWLGVALSNATHKTFAKFHLDWRGTQWSFGNTQAQTMMVEWLVTNHLASILSPGNWRELTGAGFTSPIVGPSDFVAGASAPVSTSIGADGDFTLAPDEVLLLRWTREGSDGGVILGVDDVALRYAARRVPTALIFR